MASSGAGVKPEIGNGDCCLLSGSDPDHPATACPSGNLLLAYVAPNIVLGRRRQYAIFRPPIVA
jgi:hypothetical protein